MSLGQVTVNNLNLHQGAPAQVERLFLFTGKAPTASEPGKLHAIGNDTDLDVLLGQEGSALKTQLVAARNNGGQNWYAYALPLPENADVNAAIIAALDVVSVEGVVVCDAVVAKSELEALQTTVLAIINKYQRRVFMLSCVNGPDNQSWSDYSTAIKALTDNVAAGRVMVAANVYPDFLGALAGRLARRDIQVADSPMRVATGALAGSFSDRPVDKDNQPLTLATLQDLHNNGRFTVPQWYSDYDGLYVSDGLTLAPATSDYRVIEHLRVADKAARRVYLLAVARVADRRLNSTPASIEVNKTYFMRPLREMSHSVRFAGEIWPGDIKPPADDAITIVWPTKYQVQVFLKLTPFNAPKQIECNILLDLSNEEAI